jgi:uncharacterized protein YodC (DUF2158 family)
MAHSFAEGTIVFLKSGGPPVTVETGLYPPDSDLVGIIWFAGDGLKRDCVHKDALILKETTDGRS